MQRLNRTAAVLAVYSPEACIGKTCDALFNPDRSAGRTGTIRRAILMADSPVGYAVVYPRGREMPIRFGFSPLFDAGGEVDLLAGQAQALTAQTILSNADELAKVNANLKLLAEGSVDLDLSVRTTDQATAMAGMQFVAIKKEIT